MGAAGVQYAPIEGFTPIQPHLIMESVRVSLPFSVSLTLITSALKVEVRSLSFTLFALGL